MKILLIGIYFISKVRYHTIEKFLYTALSVCMMSRHSSVR